MSSRLRVRERSRTELPKKDSCIEHKNPLYGKNLDFLQLDRKPKEKPPKQKETQKKNTKRVRGLKRGEEELTRRKLKIEENEFEEEISPPLSPQMSPPSSPPSKSAFYPSSEPLLGINPAKLRSKNTSPQMIPLQQVSAKNQHLYALSAKASKKLAVSLPQVLQRTRSATACCANSHSHSPRTKPKQGSTTTSPEPTRKSKIVSPHSSPASPRFLPNFSPVSPRTNTPRISSPRRSNTPPRPTSPRIQTPRAHLVDLEEEVIITSEEVKQDQTSLCTTISTHSEKRILLPKLNLQQELQKELNQVHLRKQEKRRQKHKKIQQEDSVGKERKSRQTSAPERNTSVPTFHTRKCSTPEPTRNSVSDLIKSPRISPKCKASNKDEINVPQTETRDQTILQQSKSDTLPSQSDQENIRLSLEIDLVETTHSRSEPELLHSARLLSPHEEQHLFYTPRSSSSTSSSDVEVTSPHSHQATKNQKKQATKVLYNEDKYNEDNNTSSSEEIYDVDDEDGECDADLFNQSEEDSDFSNEEDGYVDAPQYTQETRETQNREEQEQKQNEHEPDCDFEYDYDYENENENEQENHHEHENEHGHEQQEQEQEPEHEHEQKQEKEKEKEHEHDHDHEHVPQREQEHEYDHCRQVKQQYGQVLCEIKRNLTISQENRFEQEVTSPHNDGNILEHTQNSYGVSMAPSLRIPCSSEINDHNRTTESTEEPSDEELELLLPPLSSRPERPTRLNEKNSPVTTTPGIKHREVDGKRVIVAATLDKLVEHTSPNATELPDKEFISHFIITLHQYVAKPKDLLLKFIARYTQNLPADCSEGISHQIVIRSRIIKMLMAWVTEQFQDFEEDEELRSALEMFILRMEKEPTTKAKEWAQQLKACLTEAKEKYHCVPIFNPPPIISWSCSNQSYFETMPMKELARQITLIDFATFRRIKPTELLRKAWSKSQKKVLAPNVVELIERFNKWSFWVASQIIVAQNLRQRVSYIQKFIRLCTELRQLNNFHGVMIVFSALNYGFIQRLKQTWKEISSKYAQKLKEIETLMSQEGSYKRYRETLSQCQLPALPFQAVYLTDLTFIDENEDTDADGLINWDKMCLLGKVLCDIDRFQKVWYNLDVVPEIRDFLLDTENVKMVVLPEDELWQQSKLIESPHQSSSGAHNFEKPHRKDSASFKVSTWGRKKKTKPLASFSSVPS